MNQKYLEKRLALKKKELKERQAYYQTCFELEFGSTSNYERNAINELLVIMQLKTVIEELELLLQMINMADI